MLPILQFRVGAAAVLAVTLAASPILLIAQAPSADVPPHHNPNQAHALSCSMRLLPTRRASLISGLKADDFVVEENGKKQRIATFTSRPAEHKPLRSRCLRACSQIVPEYLRPGGQLQRCSCWMQPTRRFKDQAYGRSQMLKYVAEQTRARATSDGSCGTDRSPACAAGIHQRSAEFWLPRSEILKPQRTGATASCRRHRQRPRPTRLQPVRNGTAAVAMAQAEVAAFTESGDWLRPGASHDRHHSKRCAISRRLLAGFPGRKNVVWLTSESPFDLMPQDRNISDAELRAELPSQGNQRPVGVNAAGALAAEARQLHGGEIMQAESQLASARHRDLSSRYAGHYGRSRNRRRQLIIPCSRFAPDLRNHGGNRGRDRRQGLYQSERNQIRDRFGRIRRQGFLLDRILSREQKVGREVSQHQRKIDSDQRHAGPRAARVISPIDPGCRRRITTTSQDVAVGSCDPTRPPRRFRSCAQAKPTGPEQSASYLSGGRQDFERRRFRRQQKNECDPICGRCITLPVRT